MTAPKENGQWPYPHRFVQDARVTSDALCGVERYPTENPGVVCGAGPAHPLHEQAGLPDLAQSVGAAPRFCRHGVAVGFGCSGCTKEADSGK